MGCAEKFRGRNSALASGGHPRLPGPSARKVSLAARAPAVCPPPLRPPHQRSPGNTGLRCRSHSRPFARAAGFEKSRSLTERSSAQRLLGAHGRSRFPATTALPAATLSADLRRAGRRWVSAARTRTTVPSSAAKGRRTPGGLGSRSPKFSNRRARSRAQVPRSSLSAAFFSLLPPRQLRAEESFAKVRSGTQGPLVPCPPGQESSVPLRRLAGLLRTTVVALRAVSGARAAGAPSGSTVEGALRTLPKTPAREPQALALGSW